MFYEYVLFLKLLGNYPLISTSAADPSSIAVDVLVSIAPTATAPATLTGSFVFSQITVNNSVAFNFSGTPSTPVSNLHQKINIDDCNDYFNYPNN